MQGELGLAVASEQQYGINVEHAKIGDHAVQDYLEAAPMQWEAIVNKTFKNKEEIMPLQMVEVESIQEELESFFLDMRSSATSSGRRSRSASRARRPTPTRSEQLRLRPAQEDADGAGLQRA
jgi:hypothetical protein